MWAFWPDIAFQHYVLARVAMRCGYWQAAASNARFAVELMLKYLLVLPQPLRPAAPWPDRGRPLTVANVRALSHRLPEIWKKFGDGYPGHQLANFTEFLTELDRWGPIRYWQLLEEGATVFAPTIKDAKRSRAANTGQAADVLALDMPKLDEFYRGLLDISGISYHVRGRGKFLVLEGRQYYEDDNPFAIP